MGPVPDDAVRFQPTDLVDAAAAEQPDTDERPDHLDRVVGRGGAGRTGSWRAAAAGGGQPWKYYDLGDGYCSYDFFAKCPHRLACARCPFYLPKNSHRGELLAVKDGIDTMLEQLELTDDERVALEGDRDAVTALVERLTDIPTPAAPPPDSSPPSRPSSRCTGSSKGRHR